MFPLKSGCWLASFAFAIVATACSSVGPQPRAHSAAISSIFDADLKARQPRNIRTAAAPPGLTMARAQGEAVYVGAGSPGRGANQSTSSYSPGEISLNFQGADLREVVQSILGDALGLTYTIDPRITGTATISSARPVSRDDLLPILEGVLAMNGAALVRSGKGYKIVEAISAAAGWADIGDARPGFGISILPLRYVSAQTVISLIDGFGATAGTVRAEASRNLLIVLGNSNDREAAIETALSFDVDWMQDQSVAILPLRHAKPETVITELERIFKSGQGGVGAETVQFMPMARLKAVLVVAPQGETVQRVRTWVGRLDSENSDLEANVYVYRVKHRDARKLASIVSQLFVGGSATADTPADQVDPAATPVVATGDLVAEPGVVPASTTAPGETVLFGSEPLLADAAASGPGRVKIQADPNNNSIVIYADGETRRAILEALTHIDVPELQVAVNVTMAEIRLTDDLRYGIQFFLKNNEGSVGLFSTLANNIGRSTPGFNFLLGSDRSPELIIDAFDQITDVQVLSSPSLVVVENETASFQVGDQIPIVTRTVTSTQDATAPITNEIDYRDTGIILNVKPRVSTDGQVAMTIEQEISSVTAGSDTLTPTISNRKISSSISVVDGQTVLLGGLISEQSGRGKSGLPGLNRVKGARNLFGRTSASNTRTELIILIRPQVIAKSEDAQQVAEELRSKMWNLGATRAR